MELKHEEFPGFDKQYFTLGYLASVYQRTPGALLEILREAGCKPALTLNNVPHFDGEAVQELERALKDGDNA